MGNVFWRADVAAIATFYYSRPSYESRIDSINLFNAPHGNLHIEKLLP
jgi:hypothetical protein